MKRLLLCGLLLLASLSVSAQTDDFSPRVQRLKNHLYYLASDSLRGRQAGTPDAMKAAAYIRQEYTAIGLKPLYEGMYVPFVLNRGTLQVNNVYGDMIDNAMETLYKDRSFRDVVAVIEGSDPELKHEFIILGAHYDHLGVASDGDVYNGADDNASGSAALIEIARELMRHRSELKRSVIIAAFDAEEMGLYGSSALARKLFNAKDADNLDCRLLSEKEPVFRMMMSIDMVGWLKQGKTLKLEGTATLRNGRSMAEDVASRVGIGIHCKSLENSVFTATDTEPFALQGVPTLAVTTGLKSPYHKPQDEADLIDYEGLDKVVEYLSQLTLEMAASPSLESSGRRAAKHNGHQDLFVMGLKAGYGSTTLNFTEGAFTSKSRLGLQGGLSARLNFGRLSLQSEACYDASRSWFSAVDGVNQTISLTDKAEYLQRSLTVPVMLMWQLTRSPSASVYVGAGGYYSWAFQTEGCGSFQVPDPYGWQWALGVRLGKLSFQLDFQYQINQLLPQPVSPIKATRTNFSLTYLLWD